MKNLLKVAKSTENSNRIKILKLLLAATGITGIFFCFLFQNGFIRKQINYIYYSWACKNNIKDINDFQINGDSDIRFETTLSPRSVKCIDISEYSSHVKILSNHSIKLLNSAGTKEARREESNESDLVSSTFFYEIDVQLPGNTQSILKLTSEDHYKLFKVSINKSLAKTDRSQSISTASASDAETVPEKITTPIQNSNYDSKNGDDFLGVYNIQKAPPIRVDQDLQAIVDAVVEVTSAQGLPTEKFSISLLNLYGECCSYAGFQDQELRYPASVSKLFWGVIFSDQKSRGAIPLDVIPESIEYDMLYHSDNNAASIVIDMLTQTSSRKLLQQEEKFEEFKSRRYAMNSFFINAGYNRGLNISQKNFPIPELGLNEPIGNDWQIRGVEAETNPIRNQLNTFDVTRLLYEIYSGQAISQEYSNEILNSIRHSLNPDIWSQETYNSIEGFFGERLPDNTDLYTKVGWTSFSRQEAAIIHSPDNSVKYILVVFGEDTSFSQNDNIFPEISILVFRNMLMLKGR